MRYVVAIDLTRRNISSYSFKKTEIIKCLDIETQFSLENYIKLTTLQYNREKPGLIEANWHEPFFNNEKYFVFLGGSVLYRNEHKLDNKSIPTPEEVLEIIIKYGNDHYKYLKGNYYVLLVDKFKMKVIVYSSPMSMYPAFFSLQNMQLIFTNYLESFSNYFTLNIDQQGFVEFSLFDHSIHTRTLYQGVKNVPGGYLFEFTEESIKETLVYDVVKWHKENPQKKKDALGEINRTLHTSIGDYVSSTDKFNISITGGFDGRLNFSFITKNSYKNLISRSYGKPGSSQISIPEKISKKLNFIHGAVLLDNDFELNFAQQGLSAINLTCGITGFNRAVYPYAYKKYSEFSRSCILGQWDMIRPLYNNPAGVIFNDFTKAIFFEDSQKFEQRVKKFSEKNFFKSELFTDEIIKKIYQEVQEKYVLSYPELNDKLKFYFFFIKDSGMKYLHTECHLVDIFVDDYVSFADLDYLEVLCNSEYAGMYKGLLAESQFSRKSPHDLYVDLMSLNNDKLNYIFNDRHFKPGWLKYGRIGWVIAAVAKKIGRLKKYGIANDTFDMVKWSPSFYEKNAEAILKETSVYNSELINEFINKSNDDSGESYRFNRAISLKLWMQKMNMI
jgi:hypothetical protein